MIISDSSTLILLAKISILNTFLEKNKLIIPRGVYKESVVKGLEKGEADSYIINEEIGKGKIEIRDINEKKVKEVKKLFGITKGENEVISLALEKKPKLILTDDRKCINVCNALGLETSISADVVVALYKKGRIDKDKALDSLNKLKEFGWFKREIIEERIKIVGGVEYEKSLS